MTVVLGQDLGKEAGFVRYDTENGGLLLGWNNWGKLPDQDIIVAYGEWLEGILLGTLCDVHGQIEQTDLAPVDVMGFERISFAGTGKGKEYISRQEGVLQFVGRRIAWQGVEVPTLQSFALGKGYIKRLGLRDPEKTKYEKKKILKGAMIEAAKEWIRKLGHEPPEKLKTDTADATLVLGWILTNSLEGWTP